MPIKDVYSKPNQTLMLKTLYILIGNNEESLPQINIEDLWVAGSNPASIIKIE